MYSKKLTTMQEPLETDLQLAAAEIDTSVPRMKYLSNTIMEDALSIRAFQLLWDNIKETAPEITSLDDNTVLIEYLDEAIIIHETLETKYIIFDGAVTQKIEEALNNYKEVN
mgnify:CR=1 FL=1